MFIYWKGFWARVTAGAIVIVIIGFLYIIYSVCDTIWNTTHIPGG